MKVVYIAGPYRSPDGVNGIHENIELARQEARRWWLAGFAVICPHLNTAMMDGKDTDQVFLDGDLELLRRCDIIVMLDWWEKSTGAIQERRIALYSGKMVLYQSDQERFMKAAA